MRTPGVRGAAGPVPRRRTMVAAAAAAAAVLALMLPSGRVLAAGASSAAAPGQPARALGSFRVEGTITAAVDIPGEYPYETVKRTWTLTPLQCAQSTCRYLRVTRSRAAGTASLTTTLHLAGPGRYVGRGSFWVALRCRGRTYAHGSRAPYTLALSITQRTLVGAVNYATGFSATYTNPSRSDRTPCPLGPTHDAASYGGVLTSALPAPPTTTEPAPTSTLPAAPTTTSPAPVPLS